MKPAPQSEEALQNAGMVCKENFQPCSDQVRGSTRGWNCTQKPRATQKAESRCANLFGSERVTALLMGSEPCRLDTLFFSPHDAGCPEGQAGRGESEANAPKPQ